MNKDQVEGRIEETKGKVKETAGRVSGNPNMQDRGTADKVAGKIQKNFGDAKERVEDEVEDMKDDH